MSHALGVNRRVGTRYTGTEIYTSTYGSAGSKFLQIHQAPRLTSLAPLRTLTRAKIIVARRRIMAP